MLKKLQIENFHKQQFGGSNQSSIRDQQQQYCCEFKKADSNIFENLTHTYHKRENKGSLQIMPRHGEKCKRKQQIDKFQKQSTC